jgi:hypothetical protein
VNQIIVESHSSNECAVSTNYLYVSRHVNTVETHLRFVMGAVDMNPKLWNIINAEGVGVIILL